MNLDDLIEQTHEVIIKGESEYYEVKISSSLYDKLYNYGYINNDEYGNSIIKANIVKQNNLKFVVDYQNLCENFPHENAIEAIKELTERLNYKYNSIKWKSYAELYDNPISLNKSKNYDRTKDADYRNPIYYPKRKKRK